MLCTVISPSSLSFSRAILCIAGRSSMRNTEPGTQGQRISCRGNMLSAMGRLGEIASGLVHCLDYGRLRVERRGEAPSASRRGSISASSGSTAADSALDQRGFARAIVADDRKDLAGIEVEIGRSRAVTRP